jgi:hypothetical protein
MRLAMLHFSLPPERMIFASMRGERSHFGFVTIWMSAFARHLIRDRDENFPYRISLRRLCWFPFGYPSH